MAVPEAVAAVPRRASDGELEPVPGERSIDRVPYLKLTVKISLEHPSPIWRLGQGIQVSRCTAVPANGRHSREWSATWPAFRPVYTVSACQSRPRHHAAAASSARLALTSQPVRLRRCLVSTDDTQLPTLLPLLSRGKHRNPRKCACFMELASLLAGERWSDHPACTHPLLAAVARHVNDYTSDAGRPRLTGLIPSVIGLTGDDLHIDVRIALRSATTALPVVAAERQRVMAVSVLTCERVLADLDGRAVGSLEEQSRLGDIPEVDGCAVRVIVRMRDCRSWRRWAVRGCQAWRAWPIPRHRRARDGGEKRRGHPRSARSRAATGQPAAPARVAGQRPAWSPGQQEIAGPRGDVVGVAVERQPAAGQHAERPEPLRGALVADAQPPAAKQPRDRSLCFPAVAAQPVGRLDALAGDADLDAPAGQVPRQWR